MKGKELIGFCLKSAGVDFCVIAEEGLGSICERFKEQGIEYLIPVSETSSAMIADGYARASGKVGVVFTKSEPLKLITGIASAWADKTPLVIIFISSLGQGLGVKKFDSRQVELTQVFKPITRFQARVKQVEDIPELLIQSFREAVSLRGGPVIIEVLESLLDKEIELSEKELEQFKLRLENSVQAVRTGGELERVQKAVEMLVGARKPLIFSGGGVVRSGAVLELNQLAKRLHIPLISSMGGMGSVLPENPFYIGPPSYLSGEAFHTAIKEADVVLAVGCVFSGLDGFGLQPLWSKDILFIQVNIDPEHIAYNPPCELAILGDAKLIISQMLEQVGSYSPPEERKQWSERLKKLNQAHRERVINEANRSWKKIHPAKLVMEVDKIIKSREEFYIVLDGGNTCLWVGMLEDVPGPRRAFFPTGMGTLGSGLPMAIGVKKAVPEGKVILVSGDGSFLYNAQEFETLRKYQIPVLVIIFNDSAWNMIRAGQVSFVGAIYGTDLPSANYGEVAKSYGCFGAKITELKEIEPVLKQALASGLPAVVDVELDPGCVPDSLISFAMVEFEGANLSLAGGFRSILSGKQKLDIRLLNQAKYMIKNFW